VKLVALPDTVAMTEGPNRIWPLIVQRARWQRVILETVWHYRRMLFNPRYGTVGMIGMPFYVLTECLAPIFELAAALSLVLALALGLLGWPHFLMILGTITFANAFLTCAALLGQDQEVHEVRFRDLVRLVLLSPLELFLYRPCLTVARVKGVWDLVRGDKGWHKFERNHREAAPTAA
jgi:cellulose synthase/poly-beta-1,6-N-acetylglucosamine synthase-like glycosyltransferase